MQYQDPKNILTLDHTLQLLKLGSVEIKELIDNCYISKIIDSIESDSDCEDNKDDEDRESIEEAIYLLKQHLEELQIKIDPKFLVFDDSHPHFNFPDHIETFEYWNIDLYKLCYEQSLQQITNTNVVDLVTLMDFLDNLNTTNMLIKTMYILMFATENTTMFCTSIIKNVDVIKHIRELYQPFIIRAYDRVKQFCELENHCLHQLCLCFDISIGDLLMDDSRVDVENTSIRITLKYFREALRCSSYKVVFNWIDNSSDCIAYLLKEICTHDNVEVYKYAINYCWENNIFVNDEFTRKQQTNNNNTFKLSKFAFTVPRNIRKPICSIEEHCLTYGSKNIALYIYENIINRQHLLIELIRMRYYLIIQYLYENVESKEHFVDCFKNAFENIFCANDNDIYNFLSYDSTMGGDEDEDEDRDNRSEFFENQVLEYINKVNFPIEKRIEIFMYCHLNKFFKEIVENNPNIMNETLCANLIIGSLARDNIPCLNMVSEIVQRQKMRLTFDENHARIFCSKDNHLFVHENKKMISTVKTLLDNGIFDKSTIFDIVLRSSDGREYIKYFFGSQYSNCDTLSPYDIPNNVELLKLAFESNKDEIIRAVVPAIDPYTFIENYDVLKKAMSKNGHFSSYPFLRYGIYTTWSDSEYVYEYVSESGSHGSLNSVD